MAFSPTSRSAKQADTSTSTPQLPFFPALYRSIHEGQLASMLTMIFEGILA